MMMRATGGGARAVGRAGAAVLACVLALLPATAVAAPASERLEPAERIETTFIPERRSLAIDVGARRLFEIGQPPEGGMVVRALDLDDLSETATIRIPGALSGAGGFLSAMDELRHTLYVLYPAAVAADEPVRTTLTPNLKEFYEERTRATFGVVAIDTLTNRIRGSAPLAVQPALPLDASESNRIGIKAMTYHREAGRDLLYFGTEIPTGQGNLAVANHTVFVHQVDVERLLSPASASAVDWSYAVPRCGLFMARETPSLIFRSAFSPTLTIPCRQGGAQGIVTQPLETPGIVRVTMMPGATSSDTSRFRSDLFPVSGNLQFGTVAADPVSERLLVQIDGSTTEAGVWIFDVQSAAWVGLIVLPRAFAGGGTFGLGVDVARRRLYAMSKEGLDSPESIVITSSIAGTQVDQGVETTFLPPSSLRKSVPVVDPMTHRMFVSTAEGYLVLNDRIPVRPALADPDPDENTIDVRESRRTAANFVGGAQAYGARIRWVGGFRGVDRNSNTFWENPPPELSPNTGGILPQPPSEGTRDLHFARVLTTTLTNGEASAKATGIQRDLDNTDADAGNWTNYLRRWGGPDFSSERWPYPIVECTDFGSREDARDGSGYGARTTCRRDDGSVTAATVDESMAPAQIVRFAQARARTAVRRDPVRGVVAESEAEVLGLEIAGRAGIGRVLSRAETWATGRPKKSNGVGAGSSFAPVFEDVWVVDDDGRRQTVCLSDCDPAAAADAINRALGARVRVDLPEPEPTRARGTPGGFEALVVRDPFERANESSVNEEADDRRLEVPAMVITAFSDGRVPSRVVISLAAVAAESHYGIFLVQQPVGFEPPSAPPATLPPPLTSGPPAAGPSSGGGSVGSFGDLVTESVKGLRFILASPSKALRVAAMWGFLATPLILWNRRRRFVLPSGE